MFNQMLKVDSFCQYKNAMIKENSDNIEIQVIEEKVLSILKNKCCYRFNHVMVAILNQCQDLHATQMTRITSVKLNSGALESYI